MSACLCWQNAPYQTICGHFTALADKNLAHVRHRDPFSATYYGGGGFIDVNVSSILSRHLGVHLVHAILGIRPPARLKSWGWARIPRIAWTMKRVNRATLTKSEEDEISQLTQSIEQTGHSRGGGMKRFGATHRQ